MSYRITDHVVTKGSGAKEAYLFAKEISLAWNTEYAKSAELLKTKKYIILDKTIFPNADLALGSINYSSLSNFKFTNKIAACYVLTENRYLFVSFVKDTINE